MSTVHTDQFIFAGYTPASYTMVPDQLFDEQLPDLSGAELKVLLYIMRHTFGWKKASDNISLNQMMQGIRRRDGTVVDRGTGMTKKTLLAALRSLEAQGFLLSERRQSAERGNEPSNYRLNVRASHSQEEIPLPLGEKFPQGGGGEIPPRARGKNSPIQDTTIQDTTIQDTTIQDSNGSNSTPGEKPPREQPSLEQPIAVSAILRDSPSPRPPRRRRTPTPFLDRLVEEFSGELGDSVHVRSNVAQAHNLFQQTAAKTGVDERGFADHLYRARSETRQSANVKNKMAYFFVVLRDLLGLDQETPILLTEDDIQQALDIRPVPRRPDAG